MTLRELDGRMDSAELSEWLAYDRLDPLPDAWRQAGTIAAVAHNAWFRGKPLTPDDFIPRPRRKRRRMSGAQIRASIRSRPSCN